MAVKTTWPEIVAALRENDAAFQYATWRFRDLGWSPDDFRPGRRDAQEALAGILTEVEDRLEHYRPGKKEARRRIQAVRRKLELELWP